jgi:putative addiction module killer protein
MVQVSHHKNFVDWLDNLKDREAKKRIAIRLARLLQGNFGDCKSIGQGVYELRIDYGQGYRIYYKQVGDKIYLLLCGGDKSSQARDIEQALLLAANLKEKSR